MRHPVMSPQHIFLLRSQTVFATEPEPELAVDFIGGFATSLGQLAIGATELELGVSQECGTMGEQDVERLGHHFVTPQASGPQPVDIYSRGLKEGNILEFAAVDHSEKLPDIFNETGGASQNVGGDGVIFEESPSRVAGTCCAPTGLGVAHLKPIQPGLEEGLKCPLGCHPVLPQLLHPALHPAEHAEVQDPSNKVG